MEMDMNTDWVVYANYTGPLNRAINGSTWVDMLNATNVGVNAMLERPTVFFANWWTRDFYTLNLRPKELVAASSSARK
jgi:hypothetical protein